MWHDVRLGVATEIDVITGAVVRAGESAGVPTPTNRVFYALIKAQSSIVRQ
jgi:ketopantoate reductase